MTLPTDYNRLPVKIPPIFTPLFDERNNDITRWVLYGGRDSGKSATSALYEMAAALRRQGAGRRGRIIAARSVQKNIDDSMLAELKKIAQLYPEMAAKFIIGQKYMRTRSGAVSFSFVGTNANPIGLKGLEGAFLAVVDEADALTQQAIDFLRPTIRAEGGVEMYSFNPTDRNTAMAKMLLKWIDGCNGRPADENLYQSFIDHERRLGVIFGTYRDNPFLSETSARRILTDQAGDMDADEFDNIYNGRFRTYTKDAYYSRCLRACELEHRIDNFKVDYSLPIYVNWDMGINDLMALVVWQPIWDYELQKFKVFVIDFVCGRGYPVDYYANMLNSLGYAGARCFLPHDGAQIRGYTIMLSAETMLKQMGFPCTIIPNQGKGAAYQRVVDTRAIFSRIYLTSPSYNARMAELFESLQRYGPKIVNDLPTATPDHTYSDACDAFGILPAALKTLRQPKVDSPRSKFDRMMAERENRRDYWGAGL